MENGLALYTYFRSSAAFRVRIALEYKGLAASHHAVSLIAGEQQSDAFASVNPQQLVPALVTAGGVLTQSLAIIEYLDEAHPDTPPLVWGDPLQRAKIRSLAQLVACDIHPLNNLRVQKFLRGALHQDDEAISRWCRHWMSLGFTALEAALPGQGPHCFGDRLSLADVTLVPQVFNAERFHLDMAAYPKILACHRAAMALPAVMRAHPDQQPDRPG